MRDPVTGLELNPKIVDIEVAGRNGTIVRLTDTNGNFIDLRPVDPDRVFVTEYAVRLLREMKEDQ